MLYYATVPVVLARLRQARAEFNMPQAELARRSGIPQSQISKLEASRAKDPALSTVLALAAAMDITPETLFVQDADTFSRQLTELVQSGPMLSFEDAAQLVPVAGLIEDDRVAVVFGTDRSLTVILRVDSPALDRAAEAEHSAAFGQLANSLRWPARILSRPGPGTSRDLLICLSAPADQQNALIEQARSWRSDLNRLGVLTTLLTSAEAQSVLADALAAIPTRFLAVDAQPVSAPPGQADRLIAALSPAHAAAEESDMTVNQVHTRTLVIHQLPSVVDGNWTVPLYLDNTTVSWDIAPLDIQSFVRHHRSRLDSVQAKIAAGDTTDELVSQEADLAEFLDAIERGTTRPFSMAGQILLHTSTREQLDQLTGTVYLAADQVSMLDARYRHQFGLMASLPVSPTAAASPTQPRTVHTEALMTLCPWVIDQRVTARA
jgi:transcriptional regulator with XRE-family HTH domain